MLLVLLLLFFFCFFFAILTSLKGRQPQCRYLCACGFCFVAFRNIWKGFSMLSHHFLTRSSFSLWFETCAKKKKKNAKKSEIKRQLVTHNFKIMAKSCEWVHVRATAAVRNVLSQNFTWMCWMSKRMCIKYVERNKKKAILT